MGDMAHLFYFARDFIFMVEGIKKVFPKILRKAKKGFPLME